MLLLWHHVLVREAVGHLGQVWLRNRGCSLRTWGYLWMCGLRWPRHGAWHHLRVLLGYVGLRTLVALG